MASTEEDSQEDRNKALIRSFIQEIFNEHKLSSIEKYFDDGSVEGSPHAGKGAEGLKQFLTDFFKTFPNMHTTIGHTVAEKDL
jgi:predicted SnoaL-like aldol condensation-catalyzing enzyme